MNWNTDQMENKTVELHASLSPLMVQDFNRLSSRQVMKKILEKGHEIIILDGSLIDQFSNGIFLFVEEDVHFLIQDYFYYEKLLKTQEPFEYDVTLNDGSFSFTAKSENARVNLEFKYYPGLNSANLITHKVTITKEEYTWWWRSIAHGILNLMLPT
jgi:hypothetical protein